MRHFLGGVSLIAGLACAVGMGNLFTGSCGLALLICGGILLRDQ